jgi:hypothetical protein
LPGEQPGFWSEESISAANAVEASIIQRPLDQAEIAKLRAEIEDERSKRAMVEEERDRLKSELEEKNVENTKIKDDSKLKEERWKEEKEELECRVAFLREERDKSNIRIEDLVVCVQKRKRTQEGEDLSGR